MTDSEGFSASTTQEVKVGSADPTAAFTVSPDGGTTDTNFTFNASASTAVSPATISDPLGYSWDFGDGTASVTGKIVQDKMFTPADTYTVTLVITDSAGRTDTTTATVEVAVP